MRIGNRINRQVVSILSYGGGYLACVNRWGKPAASCCSRSSGESVLKSPIAKKPLLGRARAKVESGDKRRDDALGQSRNGTERAMGLWRKHPCCSPSSLSNAWASASRALESDGDK